MKTKTFFLVFLALITIIMPVFAQQKARVAVLPFSGVEVSESEAKVITSLFETALVKTGVYNVIEQNQISEILDAQAFSLSGCTDDACAVEVGKLLAAELIVIGELSMIGGRYISNAKIIDVALGRNVNADSVSADNIGEMTDSSIALLAFKLAGLTYKKGGDERIADAFGEIFVETVPEGAEVFVNGMRRGVSPLIVEQIPLGQALISVRKGNLVGEANIELDSSDLLELIIEMEISQGRIFVKSSEKDVDVYFDSESLGPLSNGLFKDQPVGEHRLELKGDGLYWEGTVTIEDGKTVTVEAYPRAFGTLSFELQEGTAGVVKDRMTEKNIRGRNRIALPAGNYTVTVTGENYEPFEDDISITRGGTLNFAPELSFTQEYLAGKAAEEAERLARLAEEESERQARIEEEKKQAAYDELEGEIALLEADTGDGAGNLIRELEQARVCLVKLESSGYEFPELNRRSRIVLDKGLENRIDELDAMIERAERREEKKGTGKWIALGAGAAGFALSGVTYFMGASELDAYDNASTSAEALDSRDKLELYAVLQTAGLVVGGAGTGTGLLMLKKNGNIAGWKAEKADLAAEKAGIKGGL